MGVLLYNMATGVDAKNQHRQVVQVGASNMFVNKV